MTSTTVHDDLTKSTQSNKLQPQKKEKLMADYQAMINGNSAENRNKLYTWLSAHPRCTNAPPNKGVNGKHVELCRKMY